MRVHGIPVNPVWFGSQQQPGHHRGAGNNFTPKPEEATDQLGVAVVSEVARTVPTTFVQKNRLMLDA